MRTIQSTPGGFPWATNWRDVEEPTCPGHPSGRFKISSNATQQDVMWDIFWPPTMSGALSVDASMPDAVAAAPLPPRAANITISAGFPLEVIRAELLGLDLEFTRHDLWNGLSAELIANREFAVQPPGTSWPRAWPAGFPPRWAALPGGAAPAVSGLSSAVSCTLSAAQPLCGLVQLPVGDGFDGGLSFGSAIGLEAGRAYTFSAVVRASGSAGGAGLVLGVSLSPALFSANLSVVDTGAGGAWTTVSASFTASVTTPRADSLTLTVRAPQGVLEFNATSLIRDDAFMGSLRADVVDALADLHFSGPLRFPGGCFAPFYRWKDGLLPRLARPTVFTPPGYCDAVAGGVNAYTDGFEPNGLGIDEYMTLVSRVGAVPAITIPLQFGTPEEIQDARDWVEYINGDASDAAAPWAALRAARGHPEPYGVKLFYLGNEIAWQARYRNYPQNTSSTGPMSGSDYAAALELLIPALRAVDPSLILLAVDADDAFNEPWLNSDFTPFISAASAHIAYANSDAGGSPASPAAATTQAKLPTTTILPLLASTRQMLDAGAGNGAHVRISVDEWGLCPPWTVEDFNVAHAIFGSSFLTVALSTAVEFGIAYTNYFEPINEGALQVLQFSVAPTPLGFVMPLYGALAGATRVAVEQLTPGGDDDVVGVAGVLGGSLTVVLTNRNAEVGFTQWVHFDGQAVATTCSVTLLTAVGGVSAGSEFASSVLAVAVSPDGWAAIPLPAFSVASVAVECSSCDAVVAASTSEE